MLVYDITNKWSFDGIDRWLKEVEEVNIILRTTQIISSLIGLEKRLQLF
jgi:hypothetical protein